MNGITVENLLEQIQQLPEGDKLLLHSQLSKLMKSGAPGSPEVDEFETTIDTLADILDADSAKDRQPLPDDAISRAGIYEDHPAQ